MAVEEEAVVVAAGPTTVTVESGAFTVSSTVGQVITEHPLEPCFNFAVCTNVCLIPGTRT